MIDSYYPEDLDHQRIQLKKKAHNFTYESGVASLCVTVPTTSVSVSSVAYMLSLSQNTSTEGNKTRAHISKV